MIGMVRRGAMPDPDGGEPWFLCAALSEKDVEDTLNYFEESVQEVKQK
jgi:glutamate-1-semialdehyde aminotransferase